MPPDDIIAEIRAFRDAYAERFNYDMRAMYLDLKEQERISGRRYVSLPRKRIPPAKPADSPDRSAAGVGEVA